ncbi:RNA polymerase-binding transcription factor DksA [bacterium BMS3Bbin12]|nr:RNA polymerase-binding transcription factor DksA [bacterium BMS3Abin12]GBE49008.1 RNA polymerase-binding transcription factor DksA [bacterium BMS3Bbin12]GBE49340.1 RNA polymerase-binding transcription factor DksA [bacterium BMS3Bbin13]
MSPSKKTAKDSAETRKKTAAPARKAAVEKAAEPSTAKHVAKKTAAKKGMPKAAAGNVPAKPPHAATKKAPRPAAAKRTAARHAKSVSGAEAGGLLSVMGFTPYQPKKGEPYMSDAQIEHFRKVLLGWKRQLMEETERTVHHMQDEAANFPDPNDRATQEEEFSLELRTRDRERKLVKKINEALARIDIGEYGYCEACGVEIGIRRLEARPTATLCIDCKTLDEIREKQMSGV